MKLRTLYQKKKTGWKIVAQYDDDSDTPNRPLKDVDYQEINREPNTFSINVHSWNERKDFDSKGASDE